VTAKNPFNIHSCCDERQKLFSNNGAIPSIQVETVKVKIILRSGSQREGVYWFGREK
jgi:hypothetical protein